MSRDWDAEWEVLVKRERNTFRVRNAAFGELMPIFARYGAPDMELLARMEAADKAWKHAKAACDEFIADYRRAA